MQYKSSFTTENINNLPIFPIRSPDCPYPSFNIDTIITSLLFLDSNKAIGVDGVHPHVLKSCAESFAIPLCIIFQASLEQGKIPKQWKLVNVTPIYKSGNKLDPANYRPVTLNSVVCKIMEVTIKNVIMSHLQLHYLLHPAQHGFLPNRSTVTNLLELIDDITISMKNNLKIYIAYLDFAKAFDKVPITDY